jgi:hypothetical protein
VFNDYLGRSFCSPGAKAATFSERFAPALKSASSG